MILGYIVARFCKILFALRHLEKFLCLFNENDGFSRCNCFIKIDREEQLVCNFLLDLLNWDVNFDV